MAVGDTADAILTRSDTSPPAVPGPVDADAVGAAGVDVIGPLPRISGDFQGIARISRSIDARADWVPRSILASLCSGILRGRRLSLSAPVPLLRGRCTSSCCLLEYESGRWPKGRGVGEAKLCDRPILGESGTLLLLLLLLLALFLLPTSAGLIHCLLDGRGCFCICCARGPVGIVGLMDLAGPEGGALASMPGCPDETGRSWRSSARARGPVGGALRASEAGGGRVGAEPKAGGTGARGGVMALALEAEGGSTATEPCRSSLGRPLRSLFSRMSRSVSRGKSSRSSRTLSRGRIKSPSGNLWLSRSSRSRPPQRPSWDRLRGGNLESPRSS